MHPIPSILLLTLLPTLTTARIPFKFCSPPTWINQKDTPQKDAYCTIKEMKTNDTINAKLASMSTTPILDSWPYALDALPQPLLPYGIDGNMQWSEKYIIEALYTRALNVSGVEAGRHWLERKVDEDQVEHWKRTWWDTEWCLYGNDKCLVNGAQSIEMLMERDFHTKEWHKKHDDVPGQLKKAMQKKGLIKLGDMLLDFLNLEESKEVRKLCLTTVRHEAKGCNKKGEKCKTEAWDETVVRCPIDCEGEMCLRLGGEEWYLG